MMRVLGLVAALTACGDPTHHPPIVDGRPAPDAARAMDGNAACRSGIALTSTLEGKVGGSGGGKGPVVQCADMVGERIVGMALLISNQNTTFGARSAQGIRIACASVTVAPDGTASVGPVTTQEALGNGMYGWSPATWTPMAQCAPGSVVTGLLAHTGVNNDLFVNATITCTRLGPTGLPESAQQSIYIMNSLTDTTTPSQARCESGLVLSQLGAWTGAGLDAVEFVCSPSECS